ncbi:MAG TPA: hypothetical protein VNU25_02150 [Candidatus Paceibacterota bacterium]|nr:hypothetical protein [Candidatus Paceibacterota bacterium]
MNKILISSPYLRAAALLGILIVVATLGFLIGEIREGEGDVSWVPVAPRTFTSDAIGIAFEYSLRNELVEEVLERGECPEGAATAADACDHRYLGFTDGDSTLWFLSAESALFAKYPLPREGSREDTLRTWDITEYCTQGLYPLSCVESTNANGLRVVEVGYAPACNELESCSDEAFSVFFVETQNPAYPIVALWRDRSVHRFVPDEVIAEIIGSLRPLE